MKISALNLKPFEQRSKTEWSHQVDSSCVDGVISVDVVLVRGLFDAQGCSGLSW